MPSRNSATRIIINAVLESICPFPSSAMLASYHPLNKKGLGAAQGRRPKILLNDLTHAGRLAHREGVPSKDEYPAVESIA